MYDYERRFQNSVGAKRHHFSRDLVESASTVQGILLFDSDVCMVKTASINTLHHTPNPHAHCSATTPAFQLSCNPSPQSLRSREPATSNSARLPQQGRELRLLGLKVGVAADMLLLNKDIRHGALRGDLLQGVLDGGTVVCFFLKG